MDVAFALEPRRPRAEVADEVESLGHGPRAGVNVSGLLQDVAAHEQFGITGDYLETMTTLVRSLIGAGAHVVMVPHVHVPGGRGESDIGAIELVRGRLTPAELGKTTVLPSDLDAAEVKWCISQLDWFTGTRMHATIAALSTLTPAAAYAYSDKTQGVFETCRMGQHVVDARTFGGHDAVERLMSSYEDRDATRALLAEHATVTVKRSRDQLRDVFELVQHPVALPARRGTGR